MDSTSNLISWFALLIFFIFRAWRSQGLELDTIRQGHSIRDGETLVSPSNVFELGFFSPKGTTNRYVGIWYKQVVPEQTVVWVANREIPLTDKSGLLTLNDHGNLMILDGGGTPIMDMFVTPSAMNSSSATVLDSGNFMLRNEVGEVVWQSFDYPTDTFLPGMKLGFDRKMGRKWSLISWRSSEDPAPGSYSLAMNPKSTSQFILQSNDGGDIYWASGSWNGQFFSFVPEMTRSYNFNFSFTSSEDGWYFIYSLHDSNILSRLVVQVSGQIQHLTWSENAKRWYLFWAQPRDVCEAYNSCGANARCNISASNRCSCLQGFEYDFSSYQQSKPSSRRCVRRTALTCAGSVGFLRIEKVKFADRSWLYTGHSTLGIEQCESMCRRNCSCTAYAAAYRNGTGGCLFWGGELIGLRDYPPYTSADGFADGDFYVRVAASELGDNSGKKKQIRIVITVITSVILVLLSFLLCYLLRRRKLKRKERKETRKGLLSFERGTNASPANKFLDTNNPGHGRMKGPDLQCFSFASVEAATDNFSPANKLGQGGFGPVYKGKLIDGREIAVKRLSRSSGQGLEEFKNEVNVISKLQHRNLVRLLGWCACGEEKILIYEYMPNKSLDSFLFGQTKQSVLDCEKRIRIIEGIAQGLLYLHQYSRLTVIHRDLKASNILLDKDMNPKISDFGMARIFGGDQSQANTNRVVGTYGYMPPEYVLGGVFSVKSDVFSFGVLLIEVVGGKKTAAFDNFDGSLNLLGYAWELWKEGRSSELIDPMLGDTAPANRLVRFIHVGLLCVQESATDRPTMSDVVQMLTNGTAPMAVPKQPAFFTRPIAVDADVPASCRPGTASMNDVTVSEVEGR